MDLTKPIDDDDDNGEALKQRLYRYALVLALASSTLLFLVCLLAATVPKAEPLFDLLLPVCLGAAFVAAEVALAVQTGRVESAHAARNAFGILLPAGATLLASGMTALRYVDPTLVAYTNAGMLFIVTAAFASLLVSAIIPRAADETEAGK
jgi:O-antigen/teichoic acid export membrane protein